MMVHRHVRRNTSRGCVFWCVDDHSVYCAPVCFYDKRNRRPPKQFGWIEKEQARKRKKSKSKLRPRKEPGLKQDWTNLSFLPPVNFFRTPLLLSVCLSVCLSVQILLPKRATNLGTVEYLEVDPQISFRPPPWPAA